MRYTIGYECCEKLNPNHKLIGIYGIGNFKLSTILPLEEPKWEMAKLKKKTEVGVFPVFHDAKEAEAYARELCRAFRCDDTALSGKTRRSSFIRRFYALKVDTKEFPFRIQSEPESNSVSLVQRVRPLDKTETEMHRIQFLPFMLKPSVAKRLGWDGLMGWNGSL